MVAVVGAVVLAAAILFHQPAEGVLHPPRRRGSTVNPSTWCAAAHHLHLQLGTVRPPPVPQGRARVTAIHPQDPQPTKPDQRPFQQSPGSAPLRRACGRRSAPGYRQQMPFACPGFLGGIVTHGAPVSGRAHRLTVEDAAGRTPPPANAVADTGAPLIVERSPEAGEPPASERAGDGLPGAAAPAQEASGNAAAPDMQDAVDQGARIGRGPAEFLLRVAEHGVELGPWGLGQIGRVGYGSHPQSVSDRCGQKRPSPSVSRLSKQALIVLRWPAGAGRP